MLSKTERRFLQNPSAFKSSNAKLLRHRIRKKLSIIAEDIELILSNYESSGIDIEALAKVLNHHGLESKNSHSNRLQNSETQEKDDLYYLENW